LSLQRSGRGSRASATAPRAGRPGGVFVQSPKSDIYVAMLGIALGAMILGCILLLLVWGRYDYSSKPTALAPSPVRLASLDRVIAFENFSTVRL